jgi:nucleotide-binding universal stress UspA family protein
MGTGLLDKKGPVFAKQGAAEFSSADHVGSMKTTTLNKPLLPDPDTAARARSGKVTKKTISVRRILVPIDFSRASLAAIDYASKVATRLGAELNLIHVFEPQYPLVGMNAMPLYLPDPEVGLRARVHLETTAKRHRIPLRAEHIHVKKGRPFKEICRLAHKLNVDLIIVPTRGNTGLKHLVLGSTVERVVRHSLCPVLVLRATSKAGRNGKLPAASITFRKIVVPTDFSDCSMKGLGYAKNLAHEFGSTLVLLHAVHPQYYVTSDEYARYDFPLLLNQVEKVAEAQMTELVEKTDWEGIKVKSAVELGHPGQEICDRARDRRADLIVTATHGRTGLKHVFIGSTAEFVVRHAHCPVLVVPTRSASAFA